MPTAGTTTTDTITTVTAITTTITTTTITSTGTRITTAATDPAPVATERRGRWARLARRFVGAAGLLAAALAALTALCDRRAEGRFPFDVTATAASRGGAFSVREVEADGVRLRYLEGGAGPTIVFLHGAYGGAEDLLATIGPDLVRDHRVIAFDRPGHGYSERGGARHDSPAGQARTIAAALEVLEIERPTLVGFSFGGAVAAALASDRPETLSSLVLLGAPLLPWGGEAGAIDRLFSLPIVGPTLAWCGGSLVARLVAPAELAAAFEPESVAVSYAESPTGLAVRPGSLVANSRDLAGLSDELGVQRDRYDRLRMPVVLVHGNADPIVWYDHHAEPLAAELRGARLILLEGAGHQLLYTRAGDVVQAIRSVSTEPR